MRAFAQRFEVFGPVFMMTMARRGARLNPR